MIKYSSEALCLHGSTNPPKRGILKRLFKLGIWSCLSKYTLISATPVSHVENTQTTDEQKNVGRSRVTRSRVGGGGGLRVMNCRSMDNKSDYIFDHMVDNNIDIVALTETRLPNNETKC